jgi:hypothetical protein
MLSAAKRRFGLEATMVWSCYEAGRDGFGRIGSSGAWQQQTQQLPPIEAVRLRPDRAR